MYNITQTDKDFQELLSSKLSSFEADFEKNFFTQEATLELLSLGVTISITGEYKNNNLIWNVACFINISSYDLKVITKSLIFAKREWEKRLFARHACLLIYETLNDLFDLLGKDFRKIITELQDKARFESDLKLIIKELNIYKTKNFDRLQQIRNVSVAHRDQNTTEQLKVIHSISWVEAINLVSAFDKILNQTGKLLQDITSKSKELDNLA